MLKRALIAHSNMVMIIMLGAGRTAKEIFRAASRVIDYRLSSLFDSVSPLHKTFIQSEVPAFNYLCHIHLDKKVVYIELPKASSSYVLTKLLEFVGTDTSNIRNVHKRSHSGLASPDSVGARAFSALLRDPECFVFTVVRNPYLRAISCYCDKFLNTSIGDGSYISNLVMAANKLYGFMAVPGRPLTWPEFVDFVVLTAPMKIDAHWTLQSDLLPQHSMTIHRIAKVETLAADLVEIFTLLGADPVFLASLHTEHQRVSEILMQSYLISPEVEKLRKVYARDFEGFRYPTDIPGES